MRHTTFAVKTTVTDVELGEFEALVSAWEADREDDVIAPTAFDETIEAWRRSGKNLPLLFEHGTEVVGYIDPATMRAAEAGLVAAGKIDREADHGEQSWRSIKSGSAGFSIGFMSESRPRKGGGRELTSIDLLEISITSKPMHPATRATSWKAAREETDDLGFTMPTDAEIRKRATELEVAELAAKATKSSRPIQIASFEC